MHVPKVVLLIVTRHFIYSIVHNVIACDILYLYSLSVAQENYFLYLYFFLHTITVQTGQVFHEMAVVYIYYVVHLS